MKDSMEPRLKHGTQYTTDMKYLRECRETMFKTWSELPFVIMGWMGRGRDGLVQWAMHFLQKPTDINYSNIQKLHYLKSYT